jgi:hypothetical protein
MTDDPHTTPPLGNDERHALVSAYVDGEATTDERARVESDPSLLALAERYRAIKAVVADVPPLTAAREASILAAATAEHRALRSSTRSDAATGGVAPPRPARTTSTRWLSIAAGLVAVCAGGIFVATRLGDGSSDDSADVASVADATAADGARGEVRTGATDGTSGDGDDQPVEEDGELSAPAPADTTGSETTRLAGAAAVTVPQRVADEFPDERDLVVLSDADDLVEWRAGVLYNTLHTEGAGTEICNRRILGWAKYQPPPADDDAAASMLVVVVQPNANRLNALDALTCEVVLRADLP